MTTTPTIWKSQFTANAGYTAGLQYLPQTIGLANGNFLTVWTDDKSGTTYNNLVGRYFDPEGNALGERVQFSQAAQPIDEHNPAAIAAMPDGGFVLAYVCWTNDDIMVRRFDSAGSLVATRTITDNGGAVGRPSIAVDQQGNYIVSFERHYSGLDYDIRAVVFNHVSNNELDEFSPSINNDSYDLGSDVAAFTNGNIVVVNQSDDWEALVFDDSGIQCQISVSGTGARVKTFYVAEGDLNDYIAPNVAVLTSGRFVVTFEHNRGDVYFRIGSSGTAAATLGSRVTVASGNNDQAYSDVVALQDGGFFVVWHDVTADTLYGKRYNGNGVLIGGTMPIVSGLAVPDRGHGIGNPVLALTDDGRILLTFRNAVYKISQMILDPRDTYIVGTSAGEAITGQTSASLIFGGGGIDRIFGQAGSDTIDGGAGADWIQGGGGDDTIISSSRPADRVDGGTGYDAYLVDIADTRLILDLALQSYSLDPSGTAPTTSNAILGVEFVRGSNLADSMTGDARDNRLEGGESGDTLRGGGGNDDLRGGGDNDFINGGGGADSLIGGTGDDTIYVDVAGDIVVEHAGGGALDWVLASASYVLGANVEVEKLTTTLDTGTAAINLTGNSFAQAIIGNSGINIISGGGGRDTLDGGAGIVDFVDYRDKTVAVEVTLNGTTPSTVLVNGVAEDSIKNFERAYGGSAADRFIGDAQGNAFFGMGGGDYISAGAGSDVVSGGLGNDTLGGGGNADFFRFDAALGPTNIDRVNDFSHTDDGIQLENFIFTALSATPGGLNSNAFLSVASGHVATAPTHRVVYDQSNGQLWYDPTGNANGAADAKHFATLATKPANVDHTDFSII